MLVLIGKSIVPGILGNNSVAHLLSVEMENTVEHNVSI